MPLRNWWPRRDGFRAVSTRKKSGRPSPSFFSVRAANGFRNRARANVLPVHMPTIRPVSIASLRQLGEVPFIHALISTGRGFSDESSIVCSSLLPSPTSYSLARSL